jgi:3-dehydroquinate dehydratase type I
VAQTTKAPLAPCILGIVTADMLVTRRYPAALWICGGIELRADGVPVADIAGAVADFDAEKSRRGFKGPVIFTLRLRRDGGAWENADAAARNEVWESLPPGTCDWADLEVEEIASVSPTALDSLRSSGVKILLSHHAFAPEDPSAWEKAYADMKAFRPDGVKFAVDLASEDVPDLLDFGRRVGAEFPESCVLGMGVAGMKTRLISPLLGCPFTYGYLGEGPVAPGQWNVEGMQSFFERAATDKERPERDAPVRAWIEWATSLLAKVNGA